jgi:hypothetical protein
MAINSQPSTCDVDASVTSQPCAGQLGAKSASPSSAPTNAATLRRHERRAEQRARRPAQVAAHLAQDEDEAGVGDGGQHAVEGAQRRIVAVGALADHPGDQHHTSEHERHREHDGRRRPLAEQRPRRDRDEHDLQVAERRRQARADIVDRVMPEDQVGGKERARRGCVAPVTGRRGAEATALAQREQRQQRQRVAAAKDGRGRRADRCQLDEDRRERDREGARQRSQRGSPRQDATNGMLRRAPG